MDRMTGKPVSQRGQLGLGTSFAAGALMLGHMNSQGLGRYEKLIADLSRLNAAPPRPSRPKRSTAGLLKSRLSWVSWLHR